MDGDAGLGELPQVVEESRGISREAILTVDNDVLRVEGSPALLDNFKPFALAPGDSVVLDELGHFEPVLLAVGADGFTLHRKAHHLGVALLRASDVAEGIHLASTAN